MSNRKQKSGLSKWRRKKDASKDYTDTKKEMRELRWDRADFLRAASAVSGTHSQIHQGSSDRKHHAASRPHIDRLAACDFVHAAMGDGFFARIADHNEQDCVGKE